MRHRVRKTKLSRRPDHQLALRRNLVFALLTHGRIRTTLAKAKLAKVVAERLITLVKRGLSADEQAKVRSERQAISFFTSGQNSRNLVTLTTKQRKAKKRIIKSGGQYEAPQEQPRIVAKLFKEIAPTYADRNGGYTRIYRLGQRVGDGAEMAILELV